MYKSNILRLKKELRKISVGVAVFVSIDPLKYDENIFYLTGYAGMGALVVPVNSKPFLVVPVLDYEKAKETGLKCYKWEKGTKLFGLVSGILKKRKIRVRKIGIVKDKITLKTYKNMSILRRKRKIKDISEILLKIRAVKVDEEIKIIKKSCRIADKILQKCINNVKKVKFKTEAEVAAFLEYEAKKLGCDASFPPIVASGKNSSKPHYIPKNARLKRGFCVIDFGVKYKGYCSDITRTIFLGNATKKEINDYRMVLEVQKECIKMCKPGVKCNEVYSRAYNKLGEAFCHGLGHGIGVEIHELPNLKMKSKDVLRNNMVLTIEPGVYYEKKYGIRIEDDILISKNKAISLTKTAKKLVVITKPF